MRRLTCTLLCILMLGGCTAQKQEKKQYSATFLELFDTATTVTGIAQNKEAFESETKIIRDELERYHRLFDIYENYEGINNLKTVNDNAGISPVTVDKGIIELLKDCKYYYTLTDGVFNPAMGSVLKLWHDAREDGINNPKNAYLPNDTALKAAAGHINPESIIIDEAASTVFISDPDLRIDVGGIAKGWATERVANSAPAGLLISVGGNVKATGPKTEDGAPWAVGIKDPFGSSDYLHTLSILNSSVVTSGNYIRNYTVDGKLYHHIIDPGTLYPGERWVSVTVVCENSGLADVLSTYLFLTDKEKGQLLLTRFNAEAMWVDQQGQMYSSPGFKDLIRN